MTLIINTLIIVLIVVLIVRFFTKRSKARHIEMQRIIEKLDHIEDKLTEIRKLIDK